MKNTIPLIIAVVFGLAAVLAVSRTLAQKDAERGKTVEVLQATRSMDKGTILAAGDFTGKPIPADVYVAGQQVRYEDRGRVEGLKLNHRVTELSFIMWSDFEVEDSPSASVGQKEWAVPVHFADDTLLRYIERGDEIAIVLWVRERREEPRSRDMSDGNKTVEQQLARVVFPRKRVMNKTSDGVILSLPPEEAMTLLSAQRHGDLYPLLRRKGDSGTNLEIKELHAGEALTLSALKALNKSLENK